MRSVKKECSYFCSEMQKTKQKFSSDNNDNDNDNNTDSNREIYFHGGF